jgi:hypothetical protein
MEISIFKYKINLEVLILIGIVYLIMLYHMVCPCVNMPMLYESLTNMTAEPGAMAGATKPDKTKVPVGGGKKEGFSSGYGAYNLDNASPYKLGDYSVPDVSKWMQPNLTVTPGKPISAGVSAILSRPEQPVPLPEGELLMFANTEFKPEYCPNTYSNSMGCAGMTVKQYNNLQTRGGNNVPYSEY